MYKVAILGATGLVGEEMIKTLEQRDFPVKELRLLATSRSAGTKLKFKGEDILVKEVSEKEFEGIDIALFSAGASASKEWAPVAVKKGAIVIDNSSAWRMEKDVPLVVPEINPQDIDSHKGIIANPNCATIQTVVALYPLHKAGNLKSFFASTYQSVSGTGREALGELEKTARHILEKGGFNDIQLKVYPYPIAFNLLPEIGSFTEDGHSQEELKMLNESRKIMHIPDLKVSTTTVRVPVFRGHAVAVTAIFERYISARKAKDILSDAPGVKVVDDPKNHLYPVPLFSANKDEVFVGRIRNDMSFENALCMWIVSDNLRKGAALNAVQIAEYLINKRGV